MSNTKNGGNGQNRFFWILGLLKCFNRFENSHTDWIGYLNMICGEKKVKLGNIWAGRILQSLKNYSWKSNDFVIFISRLRFLIEICQSWKVVQCYLEEKINFGVIFELKNTTCIKAKIDFSKMRLWKVHLNEIQNKNTCNLL